MFSWSTTFKRCWALRVFEPMGTDPFAPCDQLPAVYDRSCYFNQAQWWIVELRPGDTQNGQANFDTIFKQTGTLCDESPKAFIGACFEGLGAITPIDANYDAPLAKQLCVDATSDPSDQLYCRSFAANTITTSGPKGSSGLPVCDGLAGQGVPILQ